MATSVGIGIKVYVTTVWSVNLASGAVLLSDLQTSFIIKIHIKLGMEEGWI